jgi:hypothetical protein
MYVPYLIHDLNSRYSCIKYGTNIWHKKRYYGQHKDRKERQTLEHLGKVSHL